MKKAILPLLLFVAVSVISASPIYVKAFTDRSIADYTLLETIGDTTYIRDFRGTIYQTYDSDSVDYNDVLFFESYTKNTSDWLDFVAWLAEYRNAERFQYVCDMVNDVLITRLTDGFEYRNDVKSKMSVYLDRLYTLNISETIQAEYDVYMSIYHSLSSHSLYWLPQAFSFDDKLEVWYNLYRDYQYPSGNLPSSRNCYIWGCSNGYSSSYPNATSPKPLNKSALYIYREARTLLESRFSNINLSDNYFIDVDWDSGISVFFYVNIYILSGDDACVIRESTLGNEVTYRIDSDSCYHVRYPCRDGKIYTDPSSWNITTEVGYPYSNLEWTTYNHVSWFKYGSFEYPWFVNIFKTVNNPTFCMPFEPMYFGEVNVDINLNHSELPLPSIIPSKVNDLRGYTIPINQPITVTESVIQITNYPIPSISPEPSPSVSPDPSISPSPSVIPEPSPSVSPDPSISPSPSSSPSPDDNWKHNIGDLPDPDDGVKGAVTTASSIIFDGINNFVWDCIGAMPSDIKSFIFGALVVLSLAGLLYICVKG